MTSIHIWREILRSGIRKGHHGYLWILKILLPVSFFTFLLEYSGWLHHLDFFLTPLMKGLSLPATAAIPLVLGMLTGIYGAVAAMTVLPLTGDQMTLVAIFLLISHNLVQEGIVQDSSGGHLLKSILFRLLASILTVMVCAEIMGIETAPAVAGTVPSDLSGAPFSRAFGSWTGDMARLCAMIYLIIMTIMILIQAMKTFRLDLTLIRRLKPLLRMMGLDESVGLLWLTAALFGITYGAAVIVDEAKESRISPREMTRLHLSIGVNHAMIEDPALFLPLGIGAIWLWLPRFVTAIVAVWILNLWYILKRRARPISLRPRSEQRPGIN